MNIVIAADKFKGALSSVAVCDAIEKGLRQAAAQYRITKLPLSDGGEGWIDAIARHVKTKTVFATVADPLFRPVQAPYLISEDGRTAYIELAQASGLLLLQPHEYNPLQTTTYGTGQLIRGAVQHGVLKIVLGIGGSATNDCGIGLAAALGYRFLDAHGNELKPVGENLMHIHTIDTATRIALNGVEVVVACDVTNQLTGDEGAAKMYAPQKGGTPEMIEMLESGMQQFAAVAQQTFGVDVTNWKSGGAAGGAGAGSVLFLGAKLVSGVQLLLQWSHAEKHIREADFVITGEGSLDAQTLHGKVVRGVVDVCTRYNKPVLALCGTLDVDAQTLQRAGLTAAFSIINKPMPLEEAMEQTSYLLTNAACNIGNFFKTASHL